MVKAVLSAGPVTVFVSRLAWDGSDGPWHLGVEAAKRAGAETLVGEWHSESGHRKAALEEMRRRGTHHFLCLDGDEVCSPELLQTLKHIAKHDLSGHVRARMETYWKSAAYAVRPREEIAPVVMLDARHSEHVHIREYTGRKPLLLSEEHGLLHHLSYAGPDERIRRKVSTWGHRHEVVEGWYQRVWLGWDEDRTMRDLHPTHPACYRAVERVPVPEVLAAAPEFIVVPGDPARPEPWPKVSVVVPVFGAAEEVRRCLASLKALKEDLHETIVVDDHGPRDAVEAAQGFTVVQTPENRGFAGACNRGYREATGDTVIFLNSDAEFTKAGLYRLIETLTSSPTIGAAGPFSDGAGYFQYFPLPSPTTDHAAFAQDFAQRDAEDFDVNMLVGFCLAVKRQAVNAAGGEPFDERFGRGFFEDNDLTYRLQRARLRTVVSARSFVRHAGGASMRHIDEDANALLKANQAVYEAKWSEDLATGFASHLCGPEPSPVRFDWSREPQRLTKETLKLAKQADISLCVIAKDEERVIGDLLKSVEGVFTQVVVVDTGSTDRTREIAAAHGAEVHDFPWTMSFSEARNESLRHATGRWVMWMDCDDTLPTLSAWNILRAVTTAPEGVTAFVVPVQFVDGIGQTGTRVDHVKVIRNFPGIGFEGRIHEQILPSIRRHGGDVVRLDAVVMHSGYDTSPEGQEKKRDRDFALLELDLNERPDHSFVLFNMGMTAHYHGDHDKAIESLRRSIELSGPNESHVRKAYSLWGASLRYQERFEEAVDVLSTGLTAIGEDPELRFQRASTYLCVKQFFAARADLEQIGSVPVDGFS
ncbi:MAG: glycosyltransferase, partial [Armatimonadetes bacterium]|nr:glycosyltransferase [Armatimonadota bacterium]